MRVIILTKSSKHGGYCVAGINYDTHELVRIVSSDVKSKGALFDNHLRYPNGQTAKVLDIADFAVSYKIGGIHQKENYLIKEGYLLGYNGHLSKDYILENYNFIDYPDIFGNMDSHIDEEELGFVNYSLMVVKISSVDIHEEYNIYGELKTKVSFLYKSRYAYDFAVTDPEYYGKTLQIKNALAVISIADEPKNGSYYKFVSKIIPYEEKDRPKREILHWSYKAQFLSFKIKENSDLMYVYYKKNTGEIYSALTFQAFPIFDKSIPGRRVIRKDWVDVTIAREKDGNEYYLVEPTVTKEDFDEWAKFKLSKKKKY